MSHPYDQYEQTRLWHVIEAAFTELEHNQDVRLTTARPYVVGYLCQQLAGQRLVTDAALGAERQGDIKGNGKGNIVS